MQSDLEFKVITSFHKRIMSLYPPELLRRVEGIIRPKRPEMLRKTLGMSFDIVYEFTVPIQGYNFFAVDIYSRIPVTEFVVQSFRRKIRSTLVLPLAAQINDGSSSDSNAETFLENNTFGMIVYRYATREALRNANTNHMRLIRLPEAGIDLAKLKESFTSDQHGKNRIPGK